MENNAIDTRGFFSGPAVPSIVMELGALSPDNPLVTESYFEYRRSTGWDSLVLGLRSERNTLEVGCGAFLRKGRLNTTLEISSLPGISSVSPFWSGLWQYCKEKEVTMLKLGTFCSPSDIVFPDNFKRCVTKNRCEFRVPLAGNPRKGLSKNHSRNAKKATKAGLQVIRTAAASAAVEHQALQNKSMNRRRSKGESGLPGSISLEGPRALLESGAGELFQAVRNGEILSSVLVLLAPKGGYYQSAGTSPEGMNLGASHFLILAIAEELQAAGAEVFNLGGADEGSTLARFKAGFGAEPVRLVARDCDMGPLWLRCASGAFRKMNSLIHRGVSE